jgi:predicted AAA+ superfamily ATPase
MFTRRLILAPSPTESFFLWGPRQTGKSTLLRATYPDAHWVDLLRSDLYRRYVERPARLREELLALPRTGLVVIDEIQKVPDLLDEVHLLIETRGIPFALCGSSARKVRRGHANLLGGRAIRFELHGLVSAELGDRMDLVRLLNHGYTPRHFLSEQPRRLLDAYVSDYLKEEVAAEGLVRNLPAFSGFLSAAALSDAELVNSSSIARDCGVSAPTVREYFQIMVDTLLGRWLPAFTRRPKRRQRLAPKYYFSDVGVVNHLARRGRLEPGSELFGKAFENWLHHELSAWIAYTGTPVDLSYWGLTTGAEVDFILGDMELALEAKAIARVTSDHLKGLRTLKDDHPEVRARWLVCLEDTPRRTDDGILILPATAFTERLWAGTWPLGEP